MPERAVRPRPSEPILHVDLDAFYASLEVLKDPTLAGKPVVVGSAAPRGVVMSASYEARARGLHSAMPSVRARRICPEAVFVPPDFDAYRAHSNRFREILLSVTPVVEPIALDEAFLDVSGATSLFGPTPEIAARIRLLVTRELSLTASVGVAASKLVAKLASTAAKPNGLLVVRTKETSAFLRPLPVSALWGVGQVTAATLGRLGVGTIEELSNVPAVILERVFGEAHAAGLLDLANGIDPRQVVSFEAPKSVSHEETYARDLDDRGEIMREILTLSYRVAARLRADGYRARTVTLKLRMPSFATITRSRTLPRPTDLATDLYRVTGELLAKIPASRRRYRLIGVAATGLVPAGAEQIELYRTGRWDQAERALDRVERRFGRGAAMPAALVERGDRGKRASSGPAGQSGARTGIDAGSGGGPGAPKR